MIAILLALLFVFVDPFSGTALNANEWCPNWKAQYGCHTIEPAPGPGLTTVFDPARVQVAGGLLTFTIRHQPYTYKGVTYPYRSGAVNGYGKQTYTTGRISARIWLACTSTGLIENWPAFWADPYAGFSHGEIDMMEGLRGHVAWHYHYRNAAGKLVQVGRTVPGNWCGWHTYGVTRWPGKLIFLYDGKIVGEVTASEIGVSLPVNTVFPIIQLDATSPGRCCGGPFAPSAVMHTDWFRYDAGIR